MPRVSDFYRMLSGVISRVQPAHAGDIRLIDYCHRVGDILYHGTISNLAGPVKATWTAEQEGEPVTSDQPMTEETFTLLWDLLASAAVFRRCVAEDLNQELDPSTHHLIGLVFTQDDEAGRCALLVPTDETDPEFTRWLEALGVPAP
jgi:hypothetical protein